RADGGWEPTALAAEDEQVVLPVAERGVGTRGAGREAEEPSGRPCPRERLPARVAGEGDVGPVVEPRAPDVPVVDRESERVDQVETRSGGDAEPADGARVLRDLGCHQDDVHHGVGGRSATRCPATARMVSPLAPLST